MPLGGVSVALSGLVGFEQGSRLDEAERSAVHGEFELAGVLGDAVDVVHDMAFAAEGLHEEIDVYHGRLDESERDRVGGQG